MKYGPVSLDQAQGKILGHHIAGPDGRRAFCKGKPLSSKDIAGLRQLGRKSSYVAELEPGDVDEDRAALGCGLELSRAHAGDLST